MQDALDLVPLGLQVIQQSIDHRNQGASRFYPWLLCETVWRLYYQRHKPGLAFQKSTFASMDDLLKFERMGNKLSKVRTKRKELEMCLSNLSRVRRSMSSRNEVMIERRQTIKKSYLTSLCPKSRPLVIRFGA